jgi:hypothetical protein
MVMTTSGTKPGGGTRMRTTPILATLVLLATLGASPAAAQERVPHGEHEGAATLAPETLSPQSRELGRSMERLREQIHETNRWMVVHGSPEGLHGVGTEMAHAGEHLQELIRRLDEARTDPAVTGDAAGRQKVDALADQVRELERELSRTLAALRTAIGYR